MVCESLKKMWPFSLGRVFQLKVSPFRSCYTSLRAAEPRPRAGTLDRVKFDRRLDYYLIRDWRVQINVLLRCVDADNQ